MKMEVKNTQVVSKFTLLKEYILNTIDFLHDDDKLGSCWRINKTSNCKPKLKYNSPLGKRMEVKIARVIT